MHRLFVDTANLGDIKSTFKRGAVSGVTTNPSLMAKEPKTNYVEHMRHICDIIKDHDTPPLSVEVFCSDPSLIYKQALELIEQINYPNINIKIPVGSAELTVINKLASEGVRVNCTCCFTTSQLCQAALAGSRYVSLFYNRARDSGEDVYRTLSTTASVIKENNLDCEIIAGSIRSYVDVTDAWASGCHVVTAGRDVIEAGLKHPGTDASVEGFLNDFSDWIE
jgi:transaldolase